MVSFAELVSVLRQAKCDWCVFFKVFFFHTHSVLLILRGFFGGGVGVQAGLSMFTDYSMFINSSMSYLVLVFLYHKAAVTRIIWLIVTQTNKKQKYMQYLFSGCPCHQKTRFSFRTGPMFTKNIYYSP